LPQLLFEYSWLKAKDSLVLEAVASNLMALYRNTANNMRKVARDPPEKEKGRFDILVSQQAKDRIGILFNFVVLLGSMHILWLDGEALNIGFAEAFYVN
jgi:hypothetical protein